MCKIYQTSCRVDTKKIKPLESILHQSCVIYNGTDLSKMRNNCICHNDQLFIETSVKKNRR